MGKNKDSRSKTRYGKGRCVDMCKYEEALNIIGNRIRYLRQQVPLKSFDMDKLAEVEINKFYFQGNPVDRIMIVLRASGCEHYELTGRCSMCSHHNGAIRTSGSISDANYANQWHSVITGSCLEKPNGDFCLDNFPVVCLYNLGSLLNENEISLNAVRHIFSSLNSFKKVKKVIIESRAEYVTEIVLSAIKECYDGILEVGIGIESSNKFIRELCHHKGMDNLNIVEEAIKNLHKCGSKALAYTNLKPAFLTEQESIDDAIKTGLDCYNMGFDAVSIEPTSLQDYSLVNYLKNMGYYRVPWLWSLPEIVKGIYAGSAKKNLDIRLGGYFDEEVLSGSQGDGFAGRNEIFPHEMSSNCMECSPQFIENIKNFNSSYDILDLEKIEKCTNCYPLWEASLDVKDSRTIPDRIIDILGRRGGHG